MNIWTSLDMGFVNVLKKKKMSSLLAENLAWKRNYIQELN